MSSWETVTLGAVCDVQRGGSPRPIEQYITEKVDGINWIKIGDVAEGAKYIERTKERIRPEGAARSRRVESGDFLLTNSMSFGRPYILRTSGCIHDGWLQLRYDKTKVTEDYLYHALSSDAVYSQFRKYASGAVVKNLNCDVVRRVVIPLPPITEQRRIAAILDQANALRAKRREALAQLDRLTQAIFIDIFGDPTQNSKGWTLKPLPEAADFQEGPGILAKDFREAGVPLIRLAGIGGGHVSLRGCNFVDPEMFARKWSHFALCEGDILVLTSATFGNPAVVGKEAAGAICYTGIIRFRPRLNDIDTTYLRHFLGSTWFMSQATALASGAVIKHFGPTHLKQMTVPLPPLDLQTQFANRAKGVERLRVSIEQALAETEVLFASLQHRAFRGEL